MTITLQPPHLDLIERSSPGRAAGVLVEVRPYQWVKNAAVLMVPGLMILSIGLGGIVAALTATLAFCLAASSVYLLNDVVDRENDRHHPTKRLRPIASGQVSVPLALGTAALAASVAAVLALLIGPALGLVVVAYLALTAAYSLFLKRIAYVDVSILAGGFVLRTLAGAVAVGVSAPPLLLASVFFGAVFISLGKRRAEAVLLGDRAAAHRSVLGTYTISMLDRSLVDVAVVTVVFFGAWVATTITGSVGMLLGFLAAMSLLTALNAYRRVFRQGAGGDPVHDLVSLPVLASLAVTGLIALSTGVIR